MNTALITGASGGLGEEFANILAEKKWNLILVARSKDKLDVIKTNLEHNHSIAVQVIDLDLSLPDATHQLMKHIEKQNVDLLINNAGFGDFGLFQDSDPLRTRNMIDLNIGTLTDLTRAVLPGMIARKSGRILNVASTAAFQPGPLMAVYYATKAYVLNFSLALSDELQGTGVTVTCLCPGPTRTGFATHANMGSSKLFRRTLLNAHEVSAAGINACLKGKVLITPGIVNAIGTFMTRFVSRSFAARVARSVQSPQ
jgi:short-subunit dehydrogenase